MVELIDHGLPTDTDLNDALLTLAHDHKLPVVATNNVHFATPDGGRLAAALAAVRARRSLSDMDGWLSGPGAYLRSGAEMAQIFARYPGVVARTVEIADQWCSLNCKARLPKPNVPAGKPRSAGYVSSPAKVQTSAMRTSARKLRSGCVKSW